MYGFLIFIYLVVCVSLTIVILLQSSKGGGLAGAFGGGGGDMGAVFGGRGAATFLSRLTTALAVGFLGLSLLISFVNRGSSSQPQSLVQQEQQKQTVASGLPLAPQGTGQLAPAPIPAATTPADSGQ